MLTYLVVTVTKKFQKEVSNIEAEKKKIQKDHAKYLRQQVIFVRFYLRSHHDGATQMQEDLKADKKKMKVTKKENKKEATTIKEKIDFLRAEWEKGAKLSN